MAKRNPNAARIPAYSLGAFALMLAYFAVNDPFPSIVRVTIWQGLWIAVTIWGLWRAQLWSWWSALFISGFGSYYAATQVLPGLLGNLWHDPFGTWVFANQWTSLLQSGLIIFSLLALWWPPVRRQFWR